MEWIFHPPKESTPPATHPYRRRDLFTLCCSPTILLLLVSALSLCSTACNSHYSLPLSRLPSSGLVPSVSPSLCSGYFLSFTHNQNLPPNRATMSAISFLRVLAHTPWFSCLSDKHFTRRAISSGLCLCPFACCQLLGDSGKMFLN